MAGPVSRFFYADDSGDLDRGWIVYGWLELSAQRWDSVLRHWLSFRKALVGEYAVPVVQEIHTTDVVFGRSRDSISFDPPERIRKGDAKWKQTLGREVVRRSLEAIAACPDIEIGVAYFRSSKTGQAITADRELAYTRLVKLWDDQLKHQKEYGVVGMDGDGTDPIYYNAHRALELDTRRVLEDPMFHSSRRSQWTQMADIIAWSGFAHLYRHDANAFAHEWYDTHLRKLNAMGEPIDLAKHP